MKKTIVKFILLLFLVLACNPVYSEEPKLFQLNEPLKVNLQFNQLSMEEAIKLALLNNPQIKIEESKLIEKHWSVKENQSYLYPHLYVGQDFVTSNNPVQAFMIKLNQRNLVFSPANVNTPGTKNNFATRIGGDWSVLDRELYKKIDLSKLELEIQKQMGREALNDLVFTVRKAYYDVILAQKRYEAYKDVHKYAEIHFNSVKEKKEAGIVSKGEFLSSKAQLSSSKESLSKAKNALNLSWIVFSDILGEEAVVGYHLTDEMKIDYGIDDVDNLVKYAYLHRPDVSAIEKRKQKSVINLKLAKASGALTIKAHGEWGVDTILDDKAIARSFTAGVFLRKSLFDGGLRRAKIKKANTEIVRRDAEIEQAYSKAKVEVVQNYLAFKNAQERLVMTDDVVADADESLRAYNERYSVGLASNVEVELAQSKLANSKILRNHALYDLNLSFITLQKVIGMPLDVLFKSNNLNISSTDKQEIQPYKANKVVEENQNLKNKEVNEDEDVVKAPNDDLEQIIFDPETEENTSILDHDNYKELTPQAEEVKTIDKKSCEQVENNIWKSIILGQLG